MSKFNEFTKAFDDAVNNGDVDGASEAMSKYVKEHSEATGKTLNESLKLTQAWMGYDMGENREAATRNTPEGQNAIQKAKQSLGL